MKHETKRRNVKDTRRLTDFHRFIKSAVLTIRMNISSYRLKICYTPEKCYHGYAGNTSIPRVAIRSRSKPNMTVWLISKHPRKSTDLKGAKERANSFRRRKEQKEGKKRPSRIKDKISLVFFVSVHALCIYFERI